MTKSPRAKFQLKIRHLNDSFFFKFDIREFLGIDNLQKKFGGSNSKIVDFSLISNFCQLLP